MSIWYYFTTYSVSLDTLSTYLVPLFITNRGLSITRYLFSITRCLLSIIRCLFGTTRYLFSTIRYLLSTIRCLLGTTKYLFSYTRCLFSITRCQFRTTGSSFSTARYLRTIKCLSFHSHEFLEFPKYLPKELQCYFKIPQLFHSPPKKPHKSWKFPKFTRKRGWSPYLLGQIQVSTRY